MDIHTVSMVLKTRGLEYDDRVRKECESLSRTGSDIRVFVLESRNEEGTRRVWGGVVAKSFSLLTRRVFPQGKGLVLKALEFNLRAFVGVLGARPRVVWAHNQEAVVVVAMSLLLRKLRVVNRVVWDQHELPSTRVLQNRWLRWLWDQLMRACDVVIVANVERRDFLREHLVVDDRVEFAVIENWADRTLRTFPETPLPSDVRAWTRGRPYLLLQGGAHPGRHFFEVVIAIAEHLDTDVGIVTVGARPEALETALRDHLGDEFGHRVFFTGWIPQMEIPTLIDHSIGSLVLYEASSPNSHYCAPNRLFQAIARGTPVIVGANPPMAKLVAGHGLGVVLEGTGTSPKEIATGVATLLADPTKHRDTIRSARDALLWENQDPEIMRIRDGHTTEEKEDAHPSRPDEAVSP